MYVLLLRCLLPTPSPTPTLTDPPPGRHSHTCTHGQVVVAIVRDNRRPAWPSTAPPDYCALAADCWAADAAARPTLHSIAQRLARLQVRGCDLV